MIKLLLALLGGVGLILILAQLLLPGIAASRISSRIGRYGSVQSVKVSAWPALELLWGHADSVTVRARRLSMSPAQAAKLVAESHGVQSMELTAAGVRLGPVAVSDARLHKHGDRLQAEASIAEASVRAALPPGFAVQLLGSEGGQVRVRASGGLFGVGSALDALAGPREGKLVVHPLGFPFERLSLTLFSDPRIFVEGVGASALPGSPPSYRLSMTARLR